MSIRNRFPSTIPAISTLVLLVAAVVGCGGGGPSLPTLTIDDVTHYEGDAGTTDFTFTVTLSAVSSADVTVDYLTQDGTAVSADGDYLATAGTVTIAAGDTTGTIVVQVNGDTEAELDETFTVELLHPSGATLADDTGLGTIAGDDVFKVLPADGADNDSFGKAVSISGDRMLIGAEQHDANGSYSGAAYIFEWDGAQWVEQAELTPDDGATGDRFGCSVSLNGDWALIGARNDDDGGSNAGAAYIFKWDGSEWVQEAKLGGAPAGANFGWSVSLYSGNAVIGAYADEAGGTNSGAAYVFSWSGGTSWDFVEKLTPSDGAAGDYFGWSVSMLSNRVVVGACNDDNANGTAAGAAYVFGWDGTTWTQQGKLLPSDGAAGDQFGYSVSIYLDELLVGSPNDDDVGDGSGSAYIFEWNGSNWVEQTKLTPAGGTAYAYFGSAVSLVDTTALIGARRDAADAAGAGAAYLFEWNGTTWDQQLKLTAPDWNANDAFGISVSLYPGWALVGSYQDDDNGDDSGSAYVFELP